MEGIISKKPVFHGWSLGGNVALSLAVNHSHLLEAIVMICSDYHWDCELGEFPNEEVAQGKVAHLLNMVKSLHIAPERVQALIEDMPVTLANAYSCNNDSTIATEFDFTINLKDISIPVAIVCGEIDPLTSVGKQETLQSTVQNGKLKVLSGCSHSIVLEDAKMVAEAVKGLL